MKKIILMPTHTVNGTGGGITVYNKRLVGLFENDGDYDISIYPHLSEESILGNKFQYQELKKDLEEAKPDIIHINGYASLIPKQVISIAKKLNVRLIYTAHWHPFETMRKSKLKRLHFDIFIKPYLKYIDTIVTINLEEYAFFSALHNNVKLIPHWLPNNLSIDKKAEKVANRILFIGTPMFGNKCFDYLYHLPVGKYDIHCVGRDTIECREDMTQHKSISDEELAELYATSSLLVVPSRYEAFSYVTLEALRSGTPVLVSDGVRIVDHLKGVSGVTVFKAGDVNEFIEKIDEAMKQKVDVDKIKKTFSAEEAKKKYENVYVSE